MPNLVCGARGFPDLQDVLDNAEELRKVCDLVAAMKWLYDNVSDRTIDNVNERCSEIFTRVVGVSSRKSSSTSLHLALTTAMTLARDTCARYVNAKVAEYINYKKFDASRNEERDNEIKKYLSGATLVKPYEDDFHPPTHLTQIQGIVDVSG